MNGRRTLLIALLWIAIGAGAAARARAQVNADGPAAAAPETARKHRTTADQIGMEVSQAAGTDAGVGDGGSIDESALFAAVAGIYRIDPALLRAIARVESGGDPAAVSRAGAEGLMQLMPATARRFGVRDPFDPVENLLGAARYISYLARRTGAAGARHHLPAILAAYNAGEGAVPEDAVPASIPETRGYVRKVLIDYILDGGAGAAGEGAGIASGGSRADGAVGVAGAKAGSDLGLLEQMAELRHWRAAEINGAGAR